MAKKKASARKSAKAKAPRKAEKLEVKSPRSVVLPGMGSVRSAKLDAICEQIGDERRTMNACRQEEASLQSAAQILMETHRPVIGAYRHAGVELVIVPGASKLRVRLTKDTGDADVTGGVEGDPAGDSADQD